MRYNKIIKVFFILLFITSAAFSAKREQVNINFKDLDISNFVKLTSKILHKNILLTSNIRGKVDFISTKPIYKDELLDIVQSVLASKGYTLIENRTFMQVVRLSEASKYNLPIVRSKTNSKQMVTESIKIYNHNVNVVASKIRYLLSKSAKLVTVNETNSILLTEFPQNIVTVKKVISLIDTDKQKDIRFVKINNLKARVVYSQAVKALKDMFNQKVAQQKIDMILNNDSNSIVIIGYKKLLDKFQKIIENFDKKDNNLKRVVKIITLKNTDAKNTFKAVQFIVKSKKYTSRDAIPVLSVDADTNSIIVLGTNESIKDIQEVIKALDKEKPQVYVKARIINVDETLTNKIGVKYGLIAGSASGSGLFGITTTLVGDPQFSALGLSGQITGMKLGSNIKQALALSTAIDFLKQNQAVNVISEPSILCINNKTSSIYVGKTISIQTGTQTTSGGVTTNKYSRNDIGLTLKIKPLISNDNKVTLDIKTILEDVIDGQGINGQPDTTKKEIQTVALVRDGENVIIGGLIKNKFDKTTSKVPVLGDIPLLGLMFRHDYNVKRKINLVIILTPYIIKTSSSLSTLRNKLTKLDIIEQKVLNNLNKYVKKKNVKH